MSERSVSPGAARRPDAGGSSTPPRIGTGLLSQVHDAVVDLPWYVVSPLLRHWHRTWGATPAEVGVAMPGDDLLPMAQYRSSRAITVGAPPDEVWPWLLQAGASW